MFKVPIPLWVTHSVTLTANCFIGAFFIIPQHTFYLFQKKPLKSKQPSRPPNYENRHAKTIVCQQSISGATLNMHNLHLDLECNINKNSKT